MSEAVYLVDGYSIIYRAYFGLLNQPLYNAKGQNTSATYGFFRSLLLLLRERNPSHLAVAMDSKVPTFRHRQYPEYKANREKAPQDLHAQVPLIEDLLESLGIPCLRADGFEADDVIATVVDLCRRAHMPCYVLSGDKDILQMVGGGVAVLHPQRGIQGFNEWDREEVYANRGVLPEQIVDYLALAGDQSDNVPGVPGIGEKTACKLLSAYGDLETIYRRIDEVTPPGVRRKLVEGQQKADMSASLVRLRTDVPLQTDLEHLRFGELDTAQAIALFAREGMKSIVEQLGGAFEEVVSFEKAEPGTYTLVTDSQELDRWLQEIRTAGIYAFDVETDSLDELEASPIGFSLAVAEGRACYVPLRAVGVKCISEHELKRRLEDLLGDAELKLVGQNVKYDYKVLAGWGVRMANIYFDTMVAAWILDSQLSSYGLDSLCERLLNYKTIHYEEVAGDGTLEEVDIQRVTDYAAEDADLSLRLYEYLAPRLEDESLKDLFYTIEMPLVSLLAEMELEGIRVRPEILAEYNHELESQLVRAEQEIYQLCGKSFNINSTKQLQEVLFEDRRLTPVKRTKTGYSTDTAVLEALAEQDRVPELILRHRGLTKLRSTYVVALPELIAPQTGRVHTHYAQTGTATGRLSSKKPNLQNIPVREEEGRRIRTAFVPADGWVFLSADYSQIELAVLAHMSRDSMLLAAFREARDIHTQTAAIIFGVSEEAISATQRRVGKTINFGVVYGMSAFRLARDLKISRQEAEQFIRRYFTKYSGVEAFINDCTSRARQNGWVVTLMGRKRKLSGIRSANRTERMAAERIAVNSPIQGSAADIVKAAMINVAKRLSDARSCAKILLQVHDELVLEVPEEELTSVQEQVRQAMESAVELDVPLKVRMSSGGSWGAL